MESAYFAINSTRRFLVRPSSVWFDAIGCDMPAHGSKAAPDRPASALERACRMRQALLRRMRR